MAARIIILAQGSQSRLPDLPVAKQLLPLPACGGTPILYRTLRQLQIMAGDQAEVTVVTWLPVMEQIFRDVRAVKVDTLADPGNSSLKGISRYLAKVPPPTSRTVVLLGDVVYSWVCLWAILANELPVMVAGTSNISPSGGELWGLSWNQRSNASVMAYLETAMSKHPPFHDTYQPGQMRKWMWAIDPNFHKSSRYTPVDDYTMDIDLPEHLFLIQALSEAAAADDLQNGVTWT